jgi:XRE family transcriptional regulator, master regulator for biofilm formation
MQLLEVLVEQKVYYSVENVDPDWLRLITQAKEEGISIEEIRIFLAQQPSDITVKDEVQP